MRYKGIGMPKAKKKSVTVIEPIVEEPAEEEDTPDPPAAPSSPPSSATIVAQLRKRLRTTVVNCARQCNTYGNANATTV